MSPFLLIKGCGKKTYEYAVLPLLMLHEADHRLSADQPMPAFVSFQLMFTAGQPSLCEGSQQGRCSHRR